MGASVTGLSEALFLWYDENRRSLPWREDPSPYHVWISEIMLQQTRVEAVKGYYARFLERFPDIPSLAQAEEDECLKLWEGLGYYSRARNLQKAARQIVAKYGGQMPRTAKELQKLSGIGPYTAAAIASISFGERVPAVDGNLLRIFARLALYEKDIRTPAAAAAAREYFLERMPRFRTGDFNQALMDLGSAVCTPGEPACSSSQKEPAYSTTVRRREEPAGGCSQKEPAGSLCPLESLCRAFREQRWADLPVMPVKKPRGIQKRTILVIRDGDRVLLQKRPSRGLLAGLYEFPGYEGWLSGAEALEKVRTLGLVPLSLRPLPEAKHIFTHREWHMQGYEIRVESLRLPREREETVKPETGAFFASIRQLQEKYAVPSAFAAYMPCEADNPCGSRQ